MSVYDQLADKYKAVPYRSVRSRPEWPEFADWFFSRGAMPDWVLRIEQRAAEAHAEIRAAGISARRSIGQLLRANSRDLTWTKTKKFNGGKLVVVEIFSRGGGGGGGKLPYGGADQ